MPARRVLIPVVPPGIEEPASDPWSAGFWRARWVRLPGDPRPPFHSAYRLRFMSERADLVRIHVAADERYILFLDGERIGHGNDRGDLRRWFFESYELDLEPGRHELFAYVWSIGDGEEFRAAHAQITLRPGFLLASETHADLVETGAAPWRGAMLDGIELLSPLAAWGIGPRRRFEAEPTGPMGMGRKTEWEPVEIAEPGRTREGANGVFPTRLLSPTIIPAQAERSVERVEVLHISAPPEGPTTDVPLLASEHRASEADAWRDILSGGEPIVIPAGERRRIILRFPEYACVFPTVRASGGPGSRVRIHVQEALFEDLERWTKGDRTEIEGRFFTTMRYRRDGIGDEFNPRGFKQDFASFDWLAGRYVEVLVEAGDKSLALFDLGFIETRYPFDLSGWPRTEDPEWKPILALCRRGAEQACHDTFIDCAYERMQYVFDARIEALQTMVFSGDDRLARKALLQIADSLAPDGMIASRHPARERQVIPLFGLHFILMINDFARWRGDPEFIRGLLPAARSVLDHFRSRDHVTPGWNYVDWVPHWRAGVPPAAEEGRDPIVRLLYLHAKLATERLAAWVAGENASAIVAEPIPKWIERGERSESVGSEHYAALLSLYPGGDEAARSRAADRLKGDEFTERCTFPFAHLLFEAYEGIGWTEGILNRVRQDWGTMVRHGLTTPIEHPEPTRSDCHGWSAHPGFHLATSLIGLTPIGYGAERFELRSPTSIGPDFEASLASPRGWIEVQVRGGRVHVNPPPGIEIVRRGSS